MSDRVSRRCSATSFSLDLSALRNVADPTSAYNELAIPLWFERPRKLLAGKRA